MSRDLRSSAGGRVSKPVVGVELNVDGRPAAFYAKNAEGMRNIGALVTRARVGSFRGWVKGQNAENARASACELERRPRASAGIHAR